MQPRLLHVHTQNGDLALHDIYLENAKSIIMECDFQGQVLWEGLRRDALKSSNLHAHMQSFLWPKTNSKISLLYFRRKV